MAVLNPPETVCSLLCTRRWNHQLKAGDRIERSHHRHMREVRLEGGPTPLAPGGPVALKVVIAGDSFMLHQIR